MENLHWEPLAPACRVLVSREHTFNTDTILLAHFAAPKHKERCIDLGTGCGTISLLWQANHGGGTRRAGVFAGLALRFGKRV